MLHRFLRDSAIYALSAALSRGIAIVLIPIYTRFLLPSEYGTLDLLMIVATVANYLVVLEISQGLARVYADARTDADKRSCVSSAAWFVVASYVVFVVIAQALAPAIATALLDSRQQTIEIRFMVLAIAMNGIYYLLLDLLRWQIQPKRHALASIVSSMVSAGVGTVAVVVADLGVVGVLAGQIAGATVGIGLTIALGGARHWSRHFDLQRIGEMLRYSTPQVISSTAAFASLYIDRLFVKELLSLDDLGVYGVGARIASLVALLMAGFQSGYIPLVFQNHAAPETPAQMARAFRYFLVGGMTIALFLSGYSRELLWLFATEQYQGAWPIIPVLATAMMLANMYIFVPGVFIAKRTGYVAAANVCAALLNAVCILVLLPRFGMIGAALSTLVSSLLLFLFYVAINARLYPIPFSWARILSAGALGIALAVGLVFLQQLSGWWWAGLKTLVFVLGVTGVSLVLLEARELKQLFSKAWHWRR